MLDWFGCQRTRRSIPFQRNGLFGEFAVQVNEIVIIRAVSFLINQGRCWKYSCYATLSKFRVTNGDQFFSFFSFSLVCFEIDPRDV